MAEIKRGSVVPVVKIYDPKKFARLLQTAPVEDKAHKDVRPMSLGRIKKLDGKGCRKEAFQFPVMKDEKMISWWPYLSATKSLERMGKRLVAGNAKKGVKDV